MTNRAYLRHYPEHNTSDFVPQFVDETEFGAQLDSVLSLENPPADWDKDRNYRPDAVNVYVTTIKKRIMKAGRRSTLMQVLKSAGSGGKDGTGDGLALINGCLSFHVVIKGSDFEKQWIEDFKKTRDS